ncbi:MAG: hypothetical protein U1G07_11070 [Verrucomicrobiota bacterium]
MASPSEDYQPTEAGPHHRRWERTYLAEGLDGVTETRTNAYVQVGTGLNRMDDTGAWVAAEAKFELIDSAAVARTTAHQVVIKGPADTVPVDVLTPDGQRLTSRVLGLGYYSPKTGQSILLAEPRPVDGHLIGQNEVLFENAFDGGFRADLRYTVTLAGLEQDVVLMEQPPLPEDAGIADDEEMRLEVITEFLAAPKPVITNQTLGPARHGNTGLTEPEFVDHTLSFGQMQMGIGAALDFDRPGPEALVPVAPIQKRWETIDERNILFEAADLATVTPFLKQLPARGGASLRKPERQVRIASRTGLVPATRAPRRSQLFAGTGSGARSGFVMDFLLVNASQTNFTFKGDTTYHISSALELFETTTLEGGAVIKYSRDAPGNPVWVKVRGPFLCRTSSYRPAVFTGFDDDSVGEIISGSNGNPTGYYAAYPIWFYGSGANMTLEHVRMHNCWVAASFYWYTGHRLRHIQAIDCGYMTLAYGCDLKVHNALAHRLESHITYAYGSPVEVQHLTAHRVGNMLRSDTLSGVAVRSKAGA